MKFPWIISCSYQNMIFSWPSTQGSVNILWGHLLTPGWTSLKVRRQNIKLKVLGNILNNNSRISQSTFTFYPCPSPRHKHKHNRMLFQPFVSTLSYHHYFFIDVIPIWNSLSSFVVNSPSPNIFPHPISFIYPSYTPMHILCSNLVLFLCSVGGLQY